MIKRKLHYGVDFMPMEAKRVILKIRILGMVKMSGSVYSYALIKKFGKMGFAKFYGPTLKNDIYNAIRVLEKSGYIKIHSKIEGGKVKNYYSITKTGSKTMRDIGGVMLSTIKEANKLFG